MKSIRAIILMLALKAFEVFTDSSCTEVTCYNEGKISNEGDLCRCLCPEGYTGLLCDIKMEPSEWPDGPYWLLMPEHGCPEMNRHGWEMGYIKITTTNLSKTDEIHLLHIANIDNTTSSILGPYTYKMNFCYKSGSHVSNVSWPNLDFAVFGRKSSCPIGHEESTLNLTLMPIMDLMTDGTVPDVNFQHVGKYTEMVFVLCIHEKSGDETVYVPMPGRSPFLFIQHPTSGCTDADDGTYTHTVFPLPTVADSEARLHLCYFIPNKTEENPLNLTEIDADCDDIRPKRVKVHIEECLRYVSLAKGRLDCPDGVAWIYVDLLQMVSLSAIKFRFLPDFMEAGLEGYVFEELFLDSTLDIFIGNVPWNDTNTFAQRCLHSTLLRLDLFGFFFNCSRNYEGRYITIRIDRHTLLAATLHTVDYIIPGTLEIRVLSCTADNGKVPSIPCNTELGMISQAIQDFQLTASSSYDKYPPRNARADRGGWQADLTDYLEPYIQIDLLAVTVINGIVIYNWYEFLNVTRNNEYLPLVEPKGCASFRLEYGTSLHNMMFYSHEAFVLDKSQTQELPQQFFLYKHFLARYIRVYPKAFSGTRTVGLKFELLGCRTFGTPSLACSDRDASQVVKAANMIVPYAYSLLPKSNMSLSCEEECMGIGQCTGILKTLDENGLSLCRLVIQGFSTRYEVLQRQAFTDAKEDLIYTAMKICWNYLDIHSARPQHIPPSATAYITSEQAISSPGYPLYYHTYFVFTWKISLKTGFIGLQFTDIYLKERSADFVRERFCEELLLIYDREYLMTRFAIDNAFNGLKTFIGSHVSYLEMEFTSCPKEYYNQQNARGFRVHVQSKDIMSCTLKSCLKGLMEITSNTFNEIPTDQTNTWEIKTYGRIGYRHVLITLEELQVSCFSGSSLTIDKPYCTLKSTVRPIELRKTNVVIEFTVSPYCPKYKFVEGFRLRYELRRSQNFISSADIRIPDLHDNTVYNESKEVCSTAYQKCYVLLGSGTSWIGSWYEAYSECKDFGMLLVSFKTKREMQFVKEFVAIHAESEVISVYIGLYRFIDGEQMSHEQWLDGRPLAFTAWLDNQPEDSERKLCTVLSFMYLLNLPSWRSVGCSDELLSSFIVCERTYHGEGESDYHHDYKATLDEPEPDTSGYLTLLTECICNAKDLSISWLYTHGNESFAFRENSQRGFFENYKQCDRACGEENGSILSTGFYYTKTSTGMDVYLQANINMNLDNSYLGFFKTLVSTNMYRITDTTNDKKVTSDSPSFNCGNGEYITVLARCNGYFECSNRNDEIGCGIECDEDQFKCTDGRCIHVSQICDFFHDCLDSSDEYCDHIPCPETSYKCADGQCIPAKKRCDAYTDCLDMSDEANCDSCDPLTAFLCQDRTCILLILVCDKQIDCPKGSDEQGCPEITFKSCDEIWASGHTNSGLYTIGDTEVECDFGKQYTRMTFLHPDWECVMKPYHGIMMFSGIGIQPSQAVKQAVVNYGYTCSVKITRMKQRSERKVDEADGALNASTYISSFGHLELLFTDTTDIQNMSDNGEFRYIEEHVKPIDDVLNFKNYTLSIDEIVCFKDTVRPSVSVLCDEFPRTAELSEKCIYNTDNKGRVGICWSMEHLQNCETYSCSSGFFKCPKSYCIPQKYVCDGIKHCQNNEDETGCQWCDTSKGTMIIAGRPDNLLWESDLHSMFRLASQLEGRVVIFKPWQSPSPFPFHATVYYTAFTGKTIPCNTETEDGRKFCLKDILDDVNATEGLKSLIWVQRMSSSDQDETPFPELFSSFDYLWNIIIKPSEQYPLRVIRGNITEIRVRNMKTLRTLGPGMFSEYCDGSEPQVCENSYRCSLSRVCLPLSQLCDEKYDCPHRDDEHFCDFVCPFNCTCWGYIVHCRESPYNVIGDVPYTSRKVDISSSTYAYKVLKIEKSLPYLAILNLSNCQIEVIRSGTFEKAKNIIHLDVSYNRISKIESRTFVHLQHLETLSLKGITYLTTLEPNSFTGLEMSVLEIKNTRIKILAAKTFSGLNLKTLDISENSIQAVDGFAFDDLSVEHLHINDNPIRQFNRDLFSGVINIKSLETSAFKFCCIRPIDLPEEKCLPHKDEFSSCSDLMSNTTLQALLWTIGLLSLFGNILSIIYRIVYDRKRLKLGYGIFVTNLAVADLLMGIYLLIIAVADRIFRGRYIEMDEYWRNSGWCKMAGILSTVSSEMSVLLICCITIDRILVIKFPFGTLKFTPKSAVVTIIVCWILSSLIAVLPVTGVAYFGSAFYGRSAVCLALPLTRERTPGWQYSIVIFIGLNFMLFLLIAVGQLLIYVEVKKQAVFQRKMNVARHNDLTVARNLLLLVLTDFLCWFPIGCMGIMALRGNFVPADVYSWTAILILPINSALNPFLYTFSIVLGRKNLNPAVEEQMRIDVGKDIAATVLNIMPYFSTSSHKKQARVTTLEDHLRTERITTQEKLVVVCQLARCLECMHSNELVFRKITGNKILLRINSSDDTVARIQFPQPIICSSKTERVENIYQFGCLVGQLFPQ